MMLILYDDYFNIVTMKEVLLGDYSRYIIDLSDFNNAKFSRVKYNDISRGECGDR